MSEKLLKFLVSELLVVRVSCRKCGRGILEVPVDRLDQALDQGECRFCGHRFHHPGQADPFNNLRNALADLRRLETDIEVGFVIPSKD